MSYTLPVLVQYPPTPPSFLTEPGTFCSSCSSINHASYLGFSFPCPCSVRPSIPFGPSGSLLFHSLVTSVVPLMQSLSFLPSCSSFSVSKSCLLIQLVPFSLSYLHFCFFHVSIAAPSVKFSVLNHWSTFPHNFHPSLFLKIRKHSFHCWIGLA